MQNERIRVITEAQYKEYMELKKHIGDTNKKVRRWKPKNGDDYYGVTGDGNIKSIIWNTDVVDCGYYQIGNCFKTEEEAQKELDRRFAEQELLDFCDWDVTEPYHIAYGRHEDIFHPTLYMGAYCPYRFASEESAQKAIDTLGTEKLKLIFRID